MKGKHCITEGETVGAVTEGEVLGIITEGETVGAVKYWEKERQLEPSMWESSPKERQLEPSMKGKHWES